MKRAQILTAAFLTLLLTLTVSAAVFAGQEPDLTMENDDQTELLCADLPEAGSDVPADQTAAEENGMTEEEAEPVTAGENEYTDDESMEPDEEQDRLLDLLSVPETEYGITYILNDDTDDPAENDPANPDHFTNLTPTFTLKAPVRTGHTFGGWFTDEGLKKKCAAIKKGTKHDVTVYAKWTRNIYVVKLNGNKATTGKPRTIRFMYDKGGNYKIDGIGFTRKGYDFAGWNEKANGSGEAFVPDENGDLTLAEWPMEDRNNAQLTLFAQWDPVVYHITYELNAPTGEEQWDHSALPAENPDSYDVTKAFKLINPQRYGYTFAGWYTDAQYRKKIAAVKKGSVGDLQLYAKWSENKYTITFMANGGKGRMTAVSGTSAEPLVLPACSFTYAGHTFRGWNLQKYARSEGCDLAPEAEIDHLKTTRNKEKIVLYAQWENNAPDYYVETNGSDTNDGLTKDTPLQTIGCALEKAGAGSVIHVGEGTFHEMLTFRKSGEITDPIILRGETPLVSERDDGTWTLSCPTKLTYDGTDEDITLIDVHGQSNIRIENFDIGDVETKNAMGIYIPENSKNISICSNRIHDLKVAPAYLKSPEEDEDNSGEANAILCLGEGAKSARAISHVLISGNEICNNVTNWSESVSVAGNSEYVTVTGNQVHDNTNIGIDFNGNTGYCPTPSLDQPRFCEATNNTVYNCHCPYASCAGIYADGARNTSISDNIVHDCDYGIEVGAEEKKDKFPVKGITVSGNLIYENAHGGIWIGGYDELETGIVVNSAILNNELKDNNKPFEGGPDDEDADEWPEIVLNRCKGITLSGNIITKTTEGPLICSEMAKRYTTGLTFTGNLYRTRNETDQIPFTIHGESVTGIDAFNKVTGGKDRAEVLP